MNAVKRKAQRVLRQATINSSRSTTFTSEAIGNQALNFISAMVFDVLG
jgi:hypothetical protein